MVNAPEKKQTILIVDDAAMNRALLADILGDGYAIIEACNGMEAVAALQAHAGSISLVLLDIVMPEMDGLEVLAVMNKRGWIRDIPVVMVSSESASSVVERAYALGVTDFINRPFDAAIVRRRVTNTLMLYAKQKALAGMVAEQISQREKSVSLMVSILSQIVEFRNGESGLHVLHVNTMTEILLRRVVEKSGREDVTPEDIGMIAMASSLHDIGKISIPEEVLNKPGRLTDEEFELMKQHAAVGAEMLRGLPHFEDEPLIRTAYEICRWHHERFDGRGYPDGLAGDEIPLSAQVVALADVYDALTSERVYKAAIPHERALEMILGGECGAFDPFLLGCLEDVADEVREQLSADSVSAYRSRVEPGAPVPTAAHEAVGPSQRTLDLLDYERMKFDFFAMMSKEVQFEYTSDTDMLAISDWGESKLGLPELIRDPYGSDELRAMFGDENLQTLRAGLRATTPDAPIVQFDFRALVGGEPRWFNLAARAMWGEGEGGLEYRGSIGKMVDVHENRQRMSELELRATHDSLTGLANHDFARKVVADRMRENPDGTFVLMVIDMDNFKDVNDTYGHLFGDEVLQHLAGRLRASVRDDDVVARVGGDEFLICMECEVEPQPLVERVFSSLTGEFRGMPLSVSMGVVSVPGGQASYDALFRSADTSLYRMKRAGRGGFEFGVVELGPEGDGEVPSILSEIEG